MWLPRQKIEEAGNAEYADIHMAAIFKEGMSFSGYERDYLGMSDRGERLIDISGVSGLDSIGDGRGAAFADFDNDGDTDIVLVSLQRDGHELFRNNVGSDRGFVARSPDWRRQRPRRLRCRGARQDGGWDSDRGEIGGVGLPGAERSAVAVRSWRQLGGGVDRGCLAERRPSSACRGCQGRGGRGFRRERRSRSPRVAATRWWQRAGSRWWTRSQAKSGC